MYRPEDGERRANRGLACAALGLTITLVLFAMLFVSLSPSQAAPAQAPVIDQPDDYLPFEGSAPASELDATSAVTLLIATSPDYWPMEYISGTQIVGHDIDLMNAIADEMGVTAVYTDRPFGEILSGLVAAEYDAVISSLTVTPGREEIIDFTLPYVTFWDSEDIAIAVQQGDEALRSQINEALRQLRADGVLETIIAAIAEDQPEWQPSLPDWTAELHVCTAGPPTCDYGSVQEAVDAAAAGDVIKVAAGTYTGVDVRPRQDVTTTGTVTQVVYISKTVTIQGGYSTSDWIVADPEANPTTLDAQGLGRVIYITGDIEPTIEGLRITGGEAQGLGGISWGADAGGGLYVITATALISNNHLFNNTSSGFLPLGGGMTLYLSDATVNGNTFSDNTSGFVGGGLYLAWSNPVISNNLFTSNSAQWGGGAFLTGSGAAFTGNVVTFNTAELGGGLVSEGGTQWFVNNVIADNQASSAGGGLWSNGSSPRLYHNTIARNSAGDGSGVYVAEGDYGGMRSTVALTNTILVDHGVGISVTGGNTVTVEAVLWHDTPVTVSQSPTATVVVQDEYLGDPAFAADGYHLTPSSVAIDRGVEVDVPVDIDGEERPQGAGYDLGADEDGVVADVALTKGDDPDPVVVGEALTYTIGVSNHGPAEATGVLMTDTLPGSATFVWASDGCTQESGMVTCNPGPLAAGEGVTFTIRVTAEAVGQLINLAEVAAQELDPDGTNNLEVEYTTVSAAPVLGPIPSGIRPTSGVNDALTPITIDGTNFQEGATASLGGTPLQSVTFVNKQRLLAVVPSGLAPGTHDLKVTNPDARSGELPKAFSVLTPDPPTLTSVNPGQGPNDLPVTVEIEGANLSPDVAASLSLDDEVVSMEGLVFLDTTRLLANVPVSTTGGLYTVTLTNPDDQSDLLADAYRVLEPAENNDLYADETDLWLDPPSIHEREAVTIGLTLRRQGGQADLQDVEVRFFLEGGTPAFTATAPVLPPRSQVTVTADWTPPPSQGDYTLYAEIDPRDIFPENNEENNLISRQVTILPPVPDTIPPTVHSLAIDDGALYNPRHYVELYVEASDNPGGTGVAYLLFVEYLFVQSEGDWVPVEMSEWLPYDLWYRRGWPLSVQPGAHYFQVWAADGAGNISPVPASQMVNWNPYTSVPFRAVHVYRQPAEAGQSFAICLARYWSGAVEIRIYDPFGGLLQRRILGSNGCSPMTWHAVWEGNYQIEVWGYTTSVNNYQLAWVVPLASTRAQVSTAGIYEDEEVTPVIPPSYAPGRHIGLPSLALANSYIYLPTVLREYTP